ncbi:MAG: N-acetylmuramoyl-L-alanine amidase [Candidatus Poribacteria bacterium]|nr:N-acetylmuramoyl-L-alanine amidase [Candidatus Poribacteria bacterium]
MKISCSCLLIVCLVALSGCMSMSGYKEASLRHHAYASGKKEATAGEWRALVPEFQKVIDTDPEGPFADDSQYGIASSWMWSIKNGDTEGPQKAIEALQELVHTYPNSPYVPYAHYWLGHCYDHINQDNQAITQYQIIENRYADSGLLAYAQLELARLYARQGYLTRAETFYSNLINAATNKEIVAAASVELQAFKSKPKQMVSSPKNIVQTQTDTPKQLPTQSKSKPKLSASASGKKELDPESLTREFGLMAKTIVIDPGHGGKDPGALGAGVIQEKGIVLSISEKLKEVLTAKGYSVLMTRHTNRLIPLKERTQFATRHKADLFLSIHANASENPQANGIETYYLDVSSTDKASEQIAARENVNSGYSIQELESLLKGIIRESKSEDSKRLAEHVQRKLVQTTGAVDRGVKHARFVVLIGTKVPAILIETGFVSNSTERRKLATSAYQSKIAAAIAEGVDEFLGKTGESPFVQMPSPKFSAKSIAKNR